METSTGNEAQLTASIRTVFAVSLVLFRLHGTYQLRIPRNNLRTVSSEKGTEEKRTCPLTLHLGSSPYKNVLPSGKPLRQPPSPVNPISGESDEADVSFSDIPLGNFVFRGPRRLQYRYKHDSHV
nr:hypothetical protein CFP56_69864 [Quercus suber]